jgi:hypothetical protein
VQLEAGALKPLDLVLPAVAKRFGHQVADRQPEQCQAFGLTRTAPAVQFEAAGPPGAEDLAADILAGLSEEPAAGLRSCAAEGGLLVAPLLGQLIGAHKPQQYIVGRRDLRVIFQAVAFEVLDDFESPWRWAALPSASPGGGTGVLRGGSTCAGV